MPSNSGRGGEINCTGSQISTFNCDYRSLAVRVLAKRKLPAFAFYFAWRIVSDFHSLFKGDCSSLFDERYSLGFLFPFFLFLRMLARHFNFILYSHFEMLKVSVNLMKRVE